MARSAQKEGDAIVWRRASGIRKNGSVGLPLVVCALVRPARQPGDCLHAPPSLVAADPGCGRKRHQAKTGRRSKKRNEQGCEDMALAIVIRRPRSIGIVLAHLSRTMRTPASNAAPIAESIDPCTKLRGMKRRSTRWTPLSTRQPRKSSSTRTICTGAPSIVADQPSWNRSVNARIRRPGESVCATRLSRSIDSELRAPGRRVSLLVEESQPRLPAFDRLPHAVRRERPSRSRQPQSHLAVERMPGRRDRARRNRS